MYKLINFPNGQLSSLILRVSDNARIPNDHNNIDYQEYLKWVAEGNTPEPAEENQ
jgi:hypothetical protein